MSEILYDKIQITTAGENVKNLIFLVESEINHLESLEKDSKDDKSKGTYKTSIKYYNCLKKELQS